MPLPTLVAQTQATSATDVNARKLEPIPLNLDAGILPDASFVGAP